MQKADSGLDRLIQSESQDVRKLRQFLIFAEQLLDGIETMHRRGTLCLFALETRIHSKLFFQPH